ncbi:hypothetical protein JCM11251_001574 [Rhodosporidiobolus azoricus]
MPRSNSLTDSSPFAPTPAVHPSFNPAAHPSMAPRALAKASSFADLRLAKNKLLKRFGGSKKGSADLDFGCGGEDEIEEEEDIFAGDQTVQARPAVRASLALLSLLDEAHVASVNKLQLRRPPLPSAPSSTQSVPTRPAPYKFPLHAPPSSDELRRLARQKEEELAAAACLDYISHHSHHARKSSRSSSLAHIDTSSLGPAIANLSLRRGSAQSSHSAVSDLLDEHGRPRSGSMASSTSGTSSRPRTNDSLPSFAESSVSTLDSTGSFPPSPVQSPTLRSRPTFSGSFSQKGQFKVDADAVAHQSRAYAFI